MVSIVKMILLRLCNFNQFTVRFFSGKIDETAKMEIVIIFKELYQYQILAEPGHFTVGSFYDKIGIICF